MASWVPSESYGQPVTNVAASLRHNARDPRRPLTSASLEHKSDVTRLRRSPARGGETLAQVKARRGTIALSHQVIDLVLRQPQPSPEKTFALIEEFFDAGDATPSLSPDGNESPGDPLQRRPF